MNKLNISVEVLQQIDKLSASMPFSYPSRLTEAMSVLTHTEQRQLLAVSWWGGDVFSEYEVALSYALLVEPNEFPDFLAMRPLRHDLKQAMRLLNTHGIRLP